MCRNVPILCLLLLSACVTASEPVAPPPVSLEQAKRIVVAGKSRMFIDPESVRDARISPPYTCPYAILHGSDQPDACVCLEANARNRLGGYTGLKLSQLQLRRGEIVGNLDMPVMVDVCRNLLPFPELNAPLRR